MLLVHRKHLSLCHLSLVFVVVLLTKKAFLRFLLLDCCICGGRRDGLERFL